LLPEQYAADRQQHHHLLLQGLRGVQLAAGGGLTRGPTDGKRLPHVVVRASPRHSVRHNKQRLAMSTQLYKTRSARFMPADSLHFHIYVM
jgi:hypothetical protein